MAASKCYKYFIFVWFVTSIIVQLVGFVTPFWGYTCNDVTNVTDVNSANSSRPGSMDESVNMSVPLNQTNSSATYSYTDFHKVNSSTVTETMSLNPTVDPITMKVAEPVCLNEGLFYVCPTTGSCYGQRVLFTHYVTGMGIVSFKVYSSYGCVMVTIVMIFNIICVAVSVSQFVVPEKFYFTIMIYSSVQAFVFPYFIALAAGVFSWSLVLCLLSTIQVAYLSWCLAVAP